MYFIHQLQLLCDVPLVEFVPHDDLDSIYFLGIISATTFRVGSLRDLAGGFPLNCGCMMILLLYLVDFGLCTGTDLLMYYVFFEVFFADDLLVQRSHPLLKGFAELTLLGRTRDIGYLGFLLVYCKSVFNIAEIKQKAIFDARLLRFLHLKPAELYI